jgi:hypothetical protein
LRNIGDIELEIGFVLEALEQEFVFSFFESRDCHELTIDTEPHCDRGLARIVVDI